MRGLKTLFVALLCASFGLCDRCLNPEIVSKSYTTEDATILKNIAYISEFNVKCKGSTPGRLYALFGDVISPVASVGPSKYQISWTEDVKTARIGHIKVKIYDESGYTQVRRALRLGEEIEHIAPLTEIEIYHPGVYQGPMISCEVLASVLSIVIAYYALHFRTKLVS